jgi:hypothetical protein
LSLSCTHQLDSPNAAWFMGFARCRQWLTMLRGGRNKFDGVSRAGVDSSPSDDGCILNTTSFDALIPILQLSIGPVILISGVGLLLLTLTNRFGRLLDRSRTLHREKPKSPEDAADLRAQISILQRRASILRLAIIFGAITVLLVAILILVLFVAALLQWEAGWLIIAIFCISQVSLIGSMVAFIHDMNLSLAAVRLEIAN